MTASNILAVYSLATVADLINGKNWYDRAASIAQGLADKYSISFQQAAGVIAALSPRNKWERNVADAEALIKTFVADPEAADSVKVCTFSANKSKAIAILSSGVKSDAAVCDILSGPKLQEFFLCISAYQDEVCIDGHAYSIWCGDRITLDSIPKMGKKLRAQIKADYVEAAKKIGVPGYVMQAVTWCTWRRLHGIG